MEPPQQCTSFPGATLAVLRTSFWLVGETKPQEKSTHHIHLLPSGTRQTQRKPAQCLAHRKREINIPWRNEEQEIHLWPKMIKHRSQHTLNLTRKYKHFGAIKNIFIMLSMPFKECGDKFSGGGKMSYFVLQNWILIILGLPKEASTYIYFLWSKSPSTLYKYKKENNQKFFNVKLFVTS